jgi:nucleotide-binding universal stress UspA family protein
MPDSLTAHLAVPVANENDAHKTAEILTAYDCDDVSAVHVVEKGKGVPDQLPLE